MRPAFPAPTHGIVNAAVGAYIFKDLAYLVHLLNAGVHGGWVVGYRTRIKYLRSPVKSIKPIGAWADVEAKSVIDLESERGAGRRWS